MKKRVALGFALVALATGCGGGSAANPSEQAKSPDSTRKTADKKGAAKKDSAGRPSRTTLRKRHRKELQKKLDEIPLPKRYAFARAAANQILQSFGFPKATFLLLDRGHTVLVTIPRKYACSIDAGRVPEVVKALKKIIVFAKKITLGVADNGGSLQGYVRANCKPLEPPAPANANAPVAYKQQGTGIKGSPEFKIKSNRWTLSWENDGGALEIYITQGNKLVDYVKTDKRGVGKKILKGPGTFRVTATGSGNWDVRVYDGV